MTDHSDPILKQTHYVDRTGWPKGPWDDEPDRVEWRDEATKLPCLIVRQGNSGHLCGYVGVPPGHMLHGKGYDEVDFADEEYYGPHGGLTYAEACAGRVCHIPQPGEPDTVWWLGFDCAHSGDSRPGDARYGDGVRIKEYKTVDYVRAECTKMAAMIIAKPALCKGWRGE